MAARQNIWQAVTMLTDNILATEGEGACSTSYRSTLRASIVESAVTKALCQSD